MTRRVIMAAIVAMVPWTTRAGDRSTDRDAERECKREGAKFCRNLSVGEAACRQQWYECCEKKSKSGRRRCVRRVTDAF
jgi:hypothetical protein